MSNSLDPDQVPQVVRPDLGPKCYQQTTKEVNSKGTVQINSVFQKKMVIFPDFAMKTFSIDAHRSS